MKLLTFCFSLLTTVSAFANPFSNFLGTFNVTGSPQVAMDGMSYCNWQGFRQITGLVISEQNGTYVAPHVEIITPFFYQQIVCVEDS